VIAPSGTIDLSVSAIQLNQNPLLNEGTNTQIQTISSVTNLGPDSATDVICTVVVPYADAFAIASTTQGAGCSHAVGSANYVCALGTLTVGEQQNTTVLMGLPTSAVPGTVTTTVTCTADQTDTNDQNNAATLSTTIQNPSSGGESMFGYSWMQWIL